MKKRLSFFTKTVITVVVIAVAVVSAKVFVPAWFENNLLEAGKVLLGL